MMMCLGMNLLQAQTIDRDVFSLLNLDYPGLEKVKAAHEAGDDARAAAELLTYYRQRTDVSTPDLDTARLTLSKREQQWADEALEHTFDVHDGYQPSFNYGKDINLHKLVDLGWKWIAWFNRYIVIPIFNFLEAHVTRNYGLIIFLLTLIVKLILSPLTYKSYLSQAKMRVLKPKIDELNAKYPNPEDAMKKQQEMMQIYSQYGVSPMGGCLPMLIQMPIWIALFNFVPNAIELRGESFLWASDLSAYDDVIRWDKSVWLIGDHLSIFCLLFCVTNLVKNAVEATKHTPDAKIVVSLSLEEEKALITVTDNARTTAESLAVHGAPLSSSKENGLGLGLLIVKTLTEKAMGHFSLERKDNVTEARITLPLPQPAEHSKKENVENDPQN